MDKAMQQRVWQRVYARPNPQGLGLCRRRAQENLKIYQSRQRHPIYGEAYQELARLCQREITMLEQMR